VQTDHRHNDNLHSMTEDDVRPQAATTTRSIEEEGEAARRTPWQGTTKTMPPRRSDADSAVAACLIGTRFSPKRSTEGFGA